MPERSGPSRRPPSRPAYGDPDPDRPSRRPPSRPAYGDPDPDRPSRRPPSRPAYGDPDRPSGRGRPRRRSSSCRGRRLVGPDVLGPRPGGHRCPGRPPVAHPEEGRSPPRLIRLAPGLPALAGRSAGFLNRLLLEPAAASARRGRHQEEGESYGRCYRLDRRCLPLAPGAPTPPTPGNGVGGVGYEYSGSDLLSQGATPQVPSAWAALTSVFGMGTGVTPPLWPPETLLKRSAGRRQ